MDTKKVAAITAMVGVGGIVPFLVYNTTKSSSNDLQKYFYKIRVNDVENNESCLTIKKQNYDYNKFLLAIRNELSITGYTGNFHIKTSKNNWIVSKTNFEYIIKTYTDFKIIKNDDSVPIKSRKYVNKSPQKIKYIKTQSYNNETDTDVDLYDNNMTNNNDDNKDDDDVGFTFNQISKHTRTGSLLMRRHSIVDLNDEKDELIFKQANDKERLQMLKSQNDQLKNLLILAENQQYGVNENPNVLSPSDIETIRAIFDNTVGDLSGTIDSTQKAIKLLYKKMGDIITDKEASKILKKLDPNNEGEIAFNSFLMYWHNSHKYGKKGKEYGKKFKFLSNKLKGKFDANKLTIKKVGKQFTTDFRFYFEYEQIDGQLKRISPWHDIPLWYTNDKTGIYNFVCEIPKWTRAKWEIATGEEYNPIKQDIKNGKLRFYKHGDMMFNYGAFPQTWEDPEHIPKDTGCVGDNDPLDVIELGTKQLQTGSVTPVKVLGVLALLDSNETDWKILAINISDPLANLMNDVHDCEKQMPGAVHAIREYLRIYKVVTGKAENRYALRGEAMNAKYAKTVITETHQQWQLLNEQRNRPDFNASLSNINRDSVNNISIH